MAAAPAAIRLDSGDLAAQSRRTRRQLDAAGLTGVRIIASGNLDETEIARLVADGAPIDGFGVGAALAVSEDAPCLDVVYKLVAYDGRGRMKLAAEKSTLPEAKQVVRFIRDGAATHDVLGLAGESADGQPLLEPVMRDGEASYRPLGAPSTRSVPTRTAHCRNAACACAGSLDPASTARMPVEISQGSSGRGGAHTPLAATAASRRRRGFQAEGAGRRLATVGDRSDISKCVISSWETAKSQTELRGVADDRRNHLRQLGAHRPT